jgi:hypothetical protein
MGKLLRCLAWIRKHDLLWFFQNPVSYFAVELGEHAFGGLNDYGNVLHAIPVEVTYDESAGVYDHRVLVHSRDRVANVRRRGLRKPESGLWSHLIASGRLRLYGLW